jgi:intron-binding protein aquarius
MSKHPQIRRHWDHLQETGAIARREGGTEEGEEKAQGKAKKATGRKRKEPAKSSPAKADVTPAKKYESDWIPSMLRLYIRTVEEFNVSADIASSAADAKAERRQRRIFIEKFTELLIDLLSQLPTRRFLNTLLDDMHIVTRARRSPLYTASEGRLFKQLTDLLGIAVHYEVDDQSGKALSAQDVLSKQTSKIHKLQHVAFTHLKEALRDLVFSSTGELGKESVLRKHLLPLDFDQLVLLGKEMSIISDADAAHARSLAEATGCMDTDDDNGASAAAGGYLLDVLIDSLRSPESQLEQLNALSLYPTEDMLWDPNQVPLSHFYTGNQTLALPKLNLQFLAIHDYLLRNFMLYRLESAFEVREDLVDAIKRIGPREGLGGKTTFGGWARMALPVLGVTIDEVRKCY